MSQETESKKDVELIKKDVSTQVLAKINAFQAAGELRLPKDYSVENALKSAYIILTDPRNNLLVKCTKESVANALLKMVVWGLSPLKKQCDFIPYGDKLECSPEYTGNIAMAKRYGGLKHIKPNAVFKGDEFAWEVDCETGNKRIVTHKQTLDSISSNEVIGAYAVITMEDGTVDTEIMSMAQIRASWNQGATKGASPAHRNFPDEMAKKTVINRACKPLIRSSNDSILMPDDDDEQKLSVSQKHIQEADKNANIETVDFTEVSETEKAIDIADESTGEVSNEVKPLF